MIRQYAAITVLALALGLSAAQAATWYVAVNGDDQWSGTLATPNTDKTDGPKATLRAARDAARAAGGQTDRRIVIAAGEYFLAEPLVLGAADSGLTLEGAGIGSILYGGRIVTGWQKDGDHFYAARLDGVADGSWDFRCLIVNGRYCMRARYPKEGRLTHESEFPVAWMSTTGGGWQRKPTDAELTTLKYKAGDLGDWLEPANAEITVYHMWDESMVGISAIDTDSRTLVFSSKAGHPPGAFGVKTYVIWNVRQGMTQPGQWCLDRKEGKVVYWPLPGEDMTRAKVIAPALTSIIRIEKAGDITLANLAVSVTTTPLKAGGFGAGAFDGAVSVSAATNCRLSGLKVFNVSGQGIVARGEKLAVERCEVHHTGACGIRFGGSECSISDNYIHHVGLTYPSAIALQGGGRDNVAAHNEIHDAPYSAVNCGGQRNRIEYNNIHRAMMELHDGGGIYCFAGNELVLRGNFIHDIPDTGGYGSSAYYLDERSENCVVENNVSLRVQRPSHNHMAKNNTLRNNVFVTDGDMRLTFPRSEGFTFTGNILVSAGKIIFDNAAAMTRLEKNILFSRQGEVVDNRLSQYNTVGSRELALGSGNVAVDPKVIVFDNGSVAYGVDSLLTELGIEAVDASGAGPGR